MIVLGKITGILNPSYPRGSPMANEVAPDPENMGTKAFPPRFPFTLLSYLTMPTSCTHLRCKEKNILFLKLNRKGCPEKWRISLPWLLKDKNSLQTQSDFALTLPRPPKDRYYRHAHLVQAKDEIRLPCFIIPPG